MKGSNQAIPTYLYVIIGLVIGAMMFMMISKYSKVFISENKVITINGNNKEISEAIAKIIEGCWEEHRMSLDDKSGICKEIEFEDQLKIKEIELNEFLDCEKLPNINCYPDECECSSDYFDDNDKIFWYAEPENTQLKISYSGSLRKIIVVGFPCDPICMCINECKKFCFNNKQICKGTNYFYGCKDNCERSNGILSTTSILEV